MHKKFGQKSSTLRRFWAWNKASAKVKPKVKSSVPFFKRKLPPVHRS